MINLRSCTADIVLVSIVVLCCVFLFFFPSAFHEKESHETHRSRGRVVAVDNTDLKRYRIILTGNQELTVEIMDGQYTRKRVAAVNHLYGKMEQDEIYAEGDKIWLEFSVINGVPANAFARGHYRVGLELLLVVLFAGLLLLIAGWTGLKAVVSFIFSSLMIWKVMVPAFLRGYDPILVGMGVVTAMTAVISFLVGGISRKGLTTFTGAMSGVMLTGVLAWFFTGGLRIHGAVRPFAETLLYAGFGHLDLTRIFIAGIFIAASGAVMDLAMDIAASMEEVLKKDPEISIRAHIASGMAVGRSVIGTMTTTLLLAYSGSYLVTIMYFTAERVPISTMLNIRFVAAEICDIMVGSFGLVTVAPFTALAGGIIYRMGKKNSAIHDNASPQ